MKSHTVPVQFQYGTHSTRDRNSFQYHHTLCTSNDSYDSKAGRFSTCTHTSSAKYFMEWTSSTLCTCPQATKTGSQNRRLVSLEKSPAPTQWKDFFEQTPIDEARHSVTLFQFSRDPYKFHLKPECKPARHAPRKVPIHLEDAFKEEIKSGGTRHSRRGKGKQWLGQLIYNCGKRILETTTPQITQSRRNWGFVWILGTWMKP